MKDLYYTLAFLLTVSSVLIYGFKMVAQDTANYFESLDKSATDKNGLQWKSTK